MESRDFPTFIICIGQRKIKSKYWRILIVLLLQNAFTESNLIYRLTGRKYCEVVVTAVILIVGIFLNIGSYKALHKKDC